MTAMPTTGRPYKPLVNAVCAPLAGLSMSSMGLKVAIRRDISDVRIMRNAVERLARETDTYSAPIALRSTAFGSPCPAPCACKRGTFFGGRWKDKLHDYIENGIRIAAVGNDQPQPDLRKTFAFPLNP